MEQAITANQQEVRAMHGDVASLVEVRAKAGWNASCWLWTCRSEDTHRNRGSVSTQPCQPEIFAHWP